MGKTDNPLLQKWKPGTVYSTARQETGDKKETSGKNEAAGKKQSFDNPLLQAWNRDDPYTQYSTLSTSRSKPVQTPELDKAVGNDKGDGITLLGRVGGAAGAGLMDSGAGFLEAGGKVAEVFGLAGGRDVVNKSPLDKLFYDNADKLREKSEDIRERAYAGVDTLGGQIALDAVGGLAQLGGDVAVGAATGGGAMIPLLARSFGGAAYEAEQDGATLGQSVLYGVGNAGLEAGIEKLTGGLGKIYGKSVADDFVEGLVKHAAKNPTAQWTLQRAINALGEGGEESLTTLLSPFVKTIYDEGEAVKSGYGTEEGRKELAKETAYSGALGAIIGLVGDIATSGVNSRAEQSPTIADALADEGPEAKPKLNRNQLDYADTAARDSAQAELHKRMVESGNVIDLTESADSFSEFFPDLRSQKKEERRPIIKAKIAELKGVLRDYLNSLKDVDYEFDVNGDVLEARLYGPGIREVLEKVTQNKAGMLGVSDQIFRSAEYLYSTGDKSNNPDVVGWDYFYVPVKFGDAESGVRIAVRNMAQTADGKTDSQIYNWNIKSAASVAGGSPGDSPLSANGSLDTASIEDTIPQNSPLVKEAPAQQSNPMVDALLGEEQQPAGPFHPINEQGAANAQQFYGRGPTYVPKENFEGHLTSKLASTLVNSGVTNNGVAQSLMDAIGRGELSHLKFTDEAAMRYAQDTIMRKGYASALEQFKSEISSGQRGKKLMALGIELLNNASTNGDNVTAADIATYLVDAATEQAQAIQVLHVLNKATPEGRLYFAVKGLDNLLARMEAKYGDRAANIEVNQDLINSYYEAVKGGNEEAITDAWGQVISDVAQQVPPNWMDKLNAWRYLSMLGNPKTHIRNIVGNAAFMPVRMMKDIVGAGLEAMTGTKNRTKAVLNRSSANDKALLQMSWGDYTKMMDTIQSGGKHNDDYGSIENERAIFGWKPLEVARKKSSEYLDKEDTWFSQRAYAHALAGWMKANGITPQQFAEMLNDTTSGAKPTVTYDLKVGDTVRASDRDNFGKIVGVNGDGSYSVHFKNDAGHEATVKLDGSILTPTGKKNTSTTFDIKTATTSEIFSEARAYAVKEAQKATYRDTNAFSEWVSKIGKVNANSSGVQKVVGTLAEGVLPFRKTPANIVVRGMEYSPIGLAYGIGEAVYGVKNGTVSAAQAIDHIASGITGTAILGLGALLAKMGVATASEDNDEKQAAFDKLRGEQAYALNVGDRSYTIDWLAPEALPFFTGIELYNWWSDAQEGGDANLQDFFDSLGALADPILETSMLSSVNDLLDSIAYARGSGFGGIGNIAKTAVMSYISQFVPTVLGQAERSFEGGRQETYTRGDSSILNASGQYDWGNLMNKNPLYDYNQVDYVDAWGRTQDYGKGNLFNQFLNPSYVSTDRSTAADSELQRLYDLGYTGVFPQRFAQSDEITTRDAEGNSTGKRHLTAEEYEQFNRTMGSTRLELAEALIGSAQYKSMSNDEKAKAIENIYAVGKAKAMLEVDPNYKPDSWVREALEAKDPAKYIAFYSAAQKLQPWGDNESVAVWQRVKYVSKAAGKDADEYVPLFFDAGSNYPQKYRMARERGYSAERFAEFYEAYATIESDRDANGKSLENVRKKVIKHLVDAGWPEQYANEMYNLFKANKTQLNDWRW